MQRKQADRGIMDELRRVKKFNKTLDQAKIPAVDNLKYVKTGRNISHWSKTCQVASRRQQRFIMIVIAC